MNQSNPGKTGKHGTKRKRLTKEEVAATLSIVGIDLDDLPLDDAGHAQRMFDIAQDEGANIAFLTREDGGTWAVFDTLTGMWSRQAPRQKLGSWVLAIGNLLLDWSQTLETRLLLDSALPDGDPEKMSELQRGDMELLIRELTSQSKRLRSSAGIGAVRSAAESFPDYHVPMADFDTDYDHIVVQNGVLDLRTGTLLPHDPKFLFTRRVDVFYDAKAKAPTFNAFIKSAIPDPDVRAFMQMSLGYTLTGHNTEQVMWMLIGGTGTGKSTLIDAIYNVFGKVKRQGYAMKAPRGLFRKDQAHWGDAAMLENARLVVDAEFAEQTVIDAALIKSLTGEQDITANKKYAPHKMFDLTGKFWLMTNHAPKFDTEHRGDEAVFRRVFVVPMNVSMYAAAYTAGTYQAMPKALKGEQAGILAWLVEGAKQWNALRSTGSGLHSVVPLAIQRAGIEWRQSMGGGDLIHEALTEAGYVFRNDKFTATNDLLDVINAFHAAIGLPKIGSEKLSDWCKKRGLDGPKPGPRPDRRRGWHGIGL